MHVTRLIAVAITIAMTAVPLVATAGSHSGIRRIFSGPESNETCVLMADYRSYCWGNTPGANSLLKIGKDLHTMALGYDFRCALTHSKEVWCWGHNGSGQAGNGGRSSSDDPTAVLRADGSVFDRVTAIAAGYAHVCALRDTSAWCWGRNDQRQIGNHNFQTSDVLFSTPVVVEEAGDPPLTNLIGITSGGFHSCGLLTDGTGACWGYDFYGQLGNAKTISGEEGTISYHFHSPQTVYVESGGLKPLVMGGEFITAGDTWTCGLVTDEVANSVACWGFNGDGELGTNNNVSSNTALPAYDEKGKIVDAFGLAVGTFATCAILTDTTVQCWGSDATQELGNAAAGSNQNHGIPLEGADGSAFSGAVEVVAGASHMCVRTINDEVYCWGSNASGQLNLPTTTSSSAAPVKINIDAPIFTDNVEGPDYDNDGF
jgi:Regulator of chromosome condensation (RCC1) repeat